jgi:hypothetical protein
MGCYKLLQHVGMIVLTQSKSLKSLSSEGELCDYGFGVGT